MDPRLQALHAMRDQVAADGGGTPEQEAARQALLADLDRQIAAVEQEVALRQNYWQTKDASDANAGALDQAWNEAVRQTETHNALYDQYEALYGAPLQWEDMSPADQATLMQSYEQASASQAGYAEQFAAQQQRATDLATMEEQWRALNEAYPDLFAGQPVMSPCLECMAQKIADYEKGLPNPLVWIKILDGDAHHIEGDAHAPSGAQGWAPQYVNAPQYAELLARFAAETFPKPASLDRLGRVVRVRVGFKYKRQERFWYRQVLTTPYQYSPAEKGRHGHYLNPPDMPAYAHAVTDANGEAVISIMIGPGAKQAWQFQAWDALGNSDTSATLWTWKVLLFGPAPMQGIETAWLPIPADMAAVDTGEPIPLVRDYLRQSNVAALVFDKRPIAYQRNVVNGQQGTLDAQAKQNFAGERARYGQSFVVVVDAHGLMVPGETAVTIPMANIRNWHDLDSAAFWYDGVDPILDANLILTGGVRVLDRSMFSFVDGYQPQCRNRLTINLEAMVGTIDPSPLAGVPVALELKYRNVARTYAGFAPPGSVWVSPMPDFWRSGPTPLAQTIVHEVGHVIGLSSWEGAPVNVPADDPGGLADSLRLRASGRKNRLDANPALYEARGHLGQHCFHGSVLEANFSAKGAKGEEGDCSMFGRIRESYTRTGGRVVAVDRTKMNYCPQCELDLTRSDFGI